MKYIKLFILSIFLLTTSFTPSNDKNYSVSQTYNTLTYVDWHKSGSGYWIESDGYNIYNDFDWMITRSIYPDNYGYYYYDIWFYSQSYYWDGQNAAYTATNIKYITVFVNNIIILVDNSNLGVTFNDTYNAKTLRFKSLSKTPTIYFKWKSMCAK